MHFVLNILLAVLQHQTGVISACTGSCAFTLSGGGARPATVEPQSPWTLEMEKRLPVFTIPLKWFTFPTLEGFNKTGAVNTRKCIYEYATSYADLLLRHFCTETEVTINKGVLTQESESTLAKLEHEYEILQHRSCLKKIITPWHNLLVGQPVSESVLKLIMDFEDRLQDLFEQFRIKIQAVATKTMRSGNNLLCANVCKSDNNILNLTEAQIPNELEEMLANGTNFVPQEQMHYKKLQSLIENDLIKASINFYRSESNIYPMVNTQSGLKKVLEQLISQTPSNSKQIEFYTAMYNQYVEHKKMFYDQLSEGHFADVPAVQNLLPNGTILTLSDKGLGPCLLPIEWYVQQYEVQSQKGGHVATNMSSDQCINFLKDVIQEFRTGLTPEERELLKTYYSKSNPNYRVGVLKLIPKIHKLSVFDSQSWNKLPSRPIRGAENCPVNPYSQSLCKMLQEMHSILKGSLKERGVELPLIYGCDEYSSNVQTIRFNSTDCSQNTLISGDFSDAFTKSSLCDLQGSISKLGQIAGWSSSKISLAKKLAKLVFENCFFETPRGIFRQSQGFPMGGHSSREGLDNILLSGEVDLLCSSIKTSLLYYYRLVDDISVTVN